MRNTSHKNECQIGAASSWGVTWSLVDVGGRALA